jgi:hypothetical protein
MKSANSPNERRIKLEMNFPEKTSTTLTLGKEERGS